MKDKKNKLLIAIALVVIGLLIFSNINVIADNEKENDQVFYNEKINTEIQTLKKPMYDFNLKPNFLSNYLAYPEFVLPGDQMNPAISTIPWKGYLAAFFHSELESIVWTYTPEDAAYFDIPGGDYPSVKRWEGTRFFGTLVPDESDSHGGVIYLFETIDHTNFDNYSLAGWDWSENPDYPGQVLWSNIIDIEIACDNSKEDWEWGFVSLVGDTSYGDGLEKAPFISYQTSESGYATMTWYLIEGCEHTDNIIDRVTHRAYSVYDYYDDSRSSWTLLFREDHFDNWDIDPELLQYFKSGADLRYPAVIANNGNIIIVAELDDGGNKNIISFFGTQLDNLYTESVVSSADDETYPDIQHISGDTYICTFIKGGNLYGCITENAGVSWSEPWQINDNNGEVISDYKTTDICESGLYTLWMEEEDDIDIWKDASIDNEPPAIPSVDGPSKGKPNTEYEYSISSSDPENENLYYYIDWGDGSSDSDLGPYSSDEDITKTHTWSEKEDYTIRVKAKDTNGLESDWGTFETSIPLTRNKQIIENTNIIERILDNFPIIRMILSLLFELI